MEGVSYYAIKFLVYSELLVYVSPLLPASCDLEQVI